jgi:hypothetical protein
MTRKISKINDLIVFSKSAKTAQKSAFDPTALNRKSTTYGPQQPKTPSNFALLSNSSKFPCIDTQTNPEFSPPPGKQAPKSPVCAKQVNPQPNKNLNRAVTCSLFPDP